MGDDLKALTIILGIMFVSVLIGTSVALHYNHKTQVACYEAAKVNIQLKCGEVK
jgi:hypothetical protein